MNKLSAIITTLALLAFSLLSGLRPAMAVPIEGQTPDGGYQTVAVSSAGALSVEIGTGTTVAVTLRAPLPLPVALSSANPNFVTITNSTLSVTGNFSSNASTVATTVTAQITVGVTPTAIYPADPARTQGVLCNGDLSRTIWIGQGGGLTTTTGIPLPAGSCFSPDVPSSFVGALNGISTAATTTGALSYIYFKP